MFDQKQKGFEEFLFKASVCGWCGAGSNRRHKDFQFLVL